MGRANARKNVLVDVVTFIGLSTRQDPAECYSTVDLSIKPPVKGSRNIFNDHQNEIFVSGHLPMVLKRGKGFQKLSIITRCYSTERGKSR